MAMKMPRPTVAALLGRWWPPPSTHGTTPVDTHCRYTALVASSSSACRSRRAASGGVGRE